MSFDMNIDPQITATPYQDPARLGVRGSDPPDSEARYLHGTKQHDHDGEISEISDVDSDYLELNAETAKLDASIEAFRAEQRIGYEDVASNVAITPSRGVRGGRGRGRGRGGKRGPRKAAKPSGDILYRLSLATEAYHQKRFADAHEILAEVIRINAETYDAWTLLSTIFEEEGDRRNALMCQVAAAHLTPKVAAMWINAANYALDGVDELPEGDQERESRLHTASQCYGAAVRAEPNNVDARTAKADVLMTLGHAGQAAAQYRRALKIRPLNIRTVRNLADAALDAKDPTLAAEAARDAYAVVINHCKSTGSPVVEEGQFEWSDLRIYLEFFTLLGEWAEGAAQLKDVARWLLGREYETYWAGWTDDDREWDISEDRRILVDDFEPARYALDSYGLGLPVDLRGRLCFYRLKLGHMDEATIHLEILDPRDEIEQDYPALDRFRDFPDCLKDLGAALLERDRSWQALDLFNIYRQLAAENEDVLVDSDLLISIGKCHFALGDKAAAEECFLDAIEEDETNIDARFELAKIYEGELAIDGKQEALLLVNEALTLDAQHHVVDPDPARAKRRLAINRARRARVFNSGRKRRPRRLGGSEEMRRYEAQRTDALQERYRACLELKERVAAGDGQAMQDWMEAAADLVDDFRSAKDLYPWENFVRAYGIGALFPGKGEPSNEKLTEMATRLQADLAPANTQDVAATLHRHEHRGIPFDQWLDIFLEYAIDLAFMNRTQEAYAVCNSAKDSVIFRSKENAFLIQVAHAMCAVYAGDEEQCVSIARFFMRDQMQSSDAYRMFAAMCRLCQTPSSWYSSGPGQKFILRQIRQMDKATTSSGEDSAEDHSKLDICLLMLYGHILSTTASYTYALSYYMRAASLDPTNAMINLSLGLAYIHYALKRQSTNRQYLLVQGFAFMFKYYEERGKSTSPAERLEAHFNLGRAYHMVGLGPLALDYYQRVLEESPAEGLRSRSIGREDLVLEAAYNVKTLCFIMGDIDGARAVTERWLVL